MRRVRRWLAFQMLAAVAFALSNCSLIVDTSGLDTWTGREDGSIDENPHDAADDGPIGVDVSDSAVDDADAPEPLAFLSPSTESGEMTVARDGVWTLAALDPTVTLTARITVGSNTSTSTGIGTLTFSLSEGASVQWIAGASAVEHTFSVSVNPALQDALGFIVNSARFVPNDKPIFQVSPNTMVPFRVNIQLWSQSNCPTCIDQVVFGIDRPTSCMSGEVGTWPGVTAEGTLSITAPSEPGSYKIRAGITQQFSCEEALAAATLSSVAFAQLIVE